MRSESAARMGLTLLTLYLYSLAPSTLPMLRIVALGVILILGLGWFGIRTWRGWVWHRTALDWVFPLWGAAFAISIAANDETWRRSVMALWYMGLYLTIWYVIHDILANRGIKREVFIDAFLLASSMIVVMGYVQLRDIGLDFLSTDPRRPSSILGNPNILGAYLIVLLAFIAGRLWNARDRLARRILWLYLFLTGFLLLTTYSRGSWVAAFSLFGLLAALKASELSGLDRKRLAEWLSENRKLALISCVTVGVIGLVLAVLVIQSFSKPGRTVSRRTVLWETAIEAFREKPLTGHGLYTFGQEYMRLKSIPPETAHNHAHNLPFHVAAELGIIGLSVLGITGIMIFRAILNNCTRVESRERGLIYGGAAAVLGTTVHQLLDMPIQFLTIATLSLGTLALAAAPLEAQQIQNKWYLRLRPALIIGLGLVLVISGVWSVSIQADYERIRDLPFGEEGTGDYRAAADEMQVVVEADPGLTWYSNQQGFLYGLAAFNGDESAIAPGITAYERFLVDDPQNATSRTNLAALEWQSGNQEAAVETMQLATDAAPESWQLWLNLGIYAESTGYTELAREAFSKALNNQSYLLAVWQESALRQEVQQTFTPSGISGVALALRNEEITRETDLNSLYDRLEFIPLDIAPHLALQALVALAQDDPETAKSLIGEVDKRITRTAHLGWYWYTQAELARYLGDTASADEAMRNVNEIVTLDFDDPDFYQGVVTSYLQYQRRSIWRQFLPQVFYPSTDPILLGLIEQ